MRGLSNPDSKLFSLLNKLGFLIELNLLVLLCCLPVVTAGAALCAMHTVLLKIYRNEEKRIVTDFFQALKANLKNGTILWLLFLGYLGLLIALGSASLRVAPEGAVYVIFGLLLGIINAIGNKRKEAK